MASAGVERKLQTRAYKRKYEIIKFTDANPGKQKTTATKFNIRLKLSDILKNLILSDLDCTVEIVHVWRQGAEN